MESTSGHLFTSLRRNRCCQQDVYLFAGTVFENIQYGKPDATQAESHQAAKKLMRMTITSLPDGYHTDIGSASSCGQKRGLVSRLLKDPPVLIFDEAPAR
jgi:ATP-binding cassette subfamily B protein